MKFGENLKLIRKSKKISQEELAEKIGVARQSVSKWETGENYPSMQNIMCLCTIFKCKINELVHEDFIDINFLDEEIKMSVVKFKKDEQKKMKGISKFICIISKIANIGTKIGLVGVIIVSIVSIYLLCNTSINSNDKTATIINEKITYEFIDNNLEFKDSKNKEYTIELLNSENVNTAEKIIEMNKVKKIALVSMIEISLIACLYIIIKLTTYLEKLFKNIHDNDTPFSMDNVHSIKMISIFTVLYLLIQDVMGSLTEIIFNLNLQIEIDLGSYILGLIILAIAYVFKYGYEIQLDSNGKLYGEENE